jgi:predicted GIY-YIG superfamily endonuclease
MNQDSAFSIGRTHQVCQDYAMHGSIQDTNFVIVCDGCSSSPHTDFGSRILAISAEKEIKRLAEFKKELWHFNEEYCILSARPIIKNLDLPEESLDSTAMIAVSSDIGNYACCYGDGVIAIGMKNGDIILVAPEYTDGYPYYMNYSNDISHRNFNIDEKKDIRKIAVSALFADGFYKKLTDDVDLSFTVMDENAIADIQISAGIQRTFITVLEPQNVKFMAVISDGIKSFYETVMTGTSKTNTPIDYHIVAHELFDFKNFTGQFVQRRLNKFLRESEKKNWYNGDDISMGVIYLGK